MENEEWRDIEGYDGRYQISNLGNVRSVGYWRVDSLGRECFYKGQPIKAQIHPLHGYASFAIRDKNGKQKRLKVHRCVAQAFIGDVEGFDVDHINFIRTDNRVENLQILSRRDNLLRSIPNRPKLSKIPLNTRQDVKAVFAIQNDGLHLAYPSISAFCGDKGLLYEKIRIIFDTEKTFTHDGVEYTSMRYSELRKSNPSFFTENLLMSRKEGCEPRKRKGFVPTKRRRRS